ncbi:tyrosine/serine/threonine protein phosphatase pps1 [Exophiala dermatitidis]|uniref:Tyrosine/serine/threonine protein phosphatase pps1 n=1 Tax=Exophiala dermatitidis TaxID=5970 RepID=A0AAN6EP87_EXODE|nr:tyrosine/serine/threonine protein phosphatase pps1 [Exophiala dermatitidis]KAJ4510022.1 tyrosine/serine/threonine protein phosphatase pps1 [Exophiala dermatitidis]KAJ4521725.1 tyrosine/serine/threonine protein phosphatase pps1 [Exophiala dermatitidis]KAJ4539417.1 tyrosine/serine/threonine protein phosphatase pps1 [Exophiala dermatitidis]KAJ4542792.1 tyrosine/serine/threonine protein phosphatase pps1 [Exophiala dermatitidis]
MATVVLQQQTPVRQSTPPPLGPSVTLNQPRSSSQVPNKHLPYCPPGPVPAQSQITPPNSPPLRQVASKPTTLLHPPHNYPKLCNSPPIYGINAKGLAEALEHYSSQPLPNPSSVFPWLHGLHPENHIQLAFFVARKRSLRKIPKCLRGITIIKAGGDLTRSRIKGAVAPDEILNLSDGNGHGFLECDPREGFSVRNFHIQAAKMALVSDIVIYGDEDTDGRIIKSVAERTASVQRRWRKELENMGQSPETHHTFVLTQPFEDVEQAHPELVAIDSRGKYTDSTLDFVQQERREMCAMSKASEISPGVFQGPTPGPYTEPPSTIDDPTYDLYIEASDHASMPDDKALAAKLKQLETRDDDDPVHLAFPSSGSIMPAAWSQAEVTGILRMCRWLYKLTHTKEPVDDAKDKNGDIQMTELTPRPRRVLLHCADGYTETSMLAVAYFMYVEGVPVHEAWIRLHCEKKRNFFAYPSDVALLSTIQERLLRESPKFVDAKPPAITAPAWLTKFDGSLPSRILPYMYLGNLNHANNPEMLRLLGIRRILSVGEPVSWSEAEMQAWGRENLFMVDRVQDNGIDELTLEMERCLEFIERGRSDGTATLVHCRVGVSRSATICIAEVMARLGLSFPRAYCFVRARRLNVIIQPHLKFVYELMKWDEQQQEKRGEPVKRELDWATVAREIAAMNRPYARN